MVQASTPDFAIGDPVILQIGGESVRGEIARVIDVDYFAIDSGNLRTYRLASELIPIEDAPNFIIEQASRAG